MKTILILFATIHLSATAFAQSTTNDIVQNYLKVKNALVESNSKQAADDATELKKSIESVQILDKKDKLLKSVEKIASTTDIEKQRYAFSQLSTTLWSVVKLADGLTQDIYYQYCPMKKAYWISNEAAIKNPYYGAKMLTCGEVKETKKK